MCRFDYDFLKGILIPASLLESVSSIMVWRKLSEQRYLKNLEVFRHLEKEAKVDSVCASNALDGIVAAGERISEIVTCGSAPLNHEESEIAGYRDVLNEINSNWQHYDFSEATVRQFHVMMRRYVDPSADGSYKKEQEIVAVPQNNGLYALRVEPASSKETSEAMEQLVLAYREVQDDRFINPLLLIPCVILDFLSIRPFAEGNERLSRLLTLLLLYKNGFYAGKYISFEQKINQKKSDYNQFLKESSGHWYSDDDYLPFIFDFIVTLYRCYEDLDKRFDTDNASCITKHGL